MGFFFMGCRFSAGNPNVTSATTFQLLGIVSSFLTFSSVKSPIQQEPTPMAQAATTMFWRAIVVLIFDHFDAIRSLWAHPTIVTGASLRNLLNTPLDNSFLISGSVRTMKCHGCLFAAGGACLPASRI